LQLVCVVIRQVPLLEQHAPVVGHAPQSWGQLLHVSPLPQLPFPQHEPQSDGQLEHVSPDVQQPSPHE